jgi:transcriptional regulator with XRE-family HTH domain
MTQNELGMLINTDKKKISRIERGMQFPDEDLLNILKQRGCDIAEILRMVKEIQSHEFKERKYGATEETTLGILRNEVKELRAKLDHLNDFIQRNFNSDMRCKNEKPLEDHNLSLEFDKIS